MTGWRGRLAVLIAILAVTPAVAQERPPSGQPVVLWEVVWERVAGSGTQAVLRFIAPEIARETGRVDATAALADLDWLCRTHGVPIATLPAARSDSVVVTMMDRAVPRGATDATATQYFGLYTIEDGKCSPADY